MQADVGSICTRHEYTDCLVFSRSTMWRKISSLTVRQEPLGFHMAMHAAVKAVISYGGAVDALLLFCLKYIHSNVLTKLQSLIMFFTIRFHLLVSHWFNIPAFSSLFFFAPQLLVIIIMSLGPLMYDKVTSWCTHPKDCFTCQDLLLPIFHNGVGGVGLAGDRQDQLFVCHFRNYWKGKQPKRRREFIPVDADRLTSPAGQRQ